MSECLNYTRTPTLIHFRIVPRRTTCNSYIASTIITLFSSFFPFILPIASLYANTHTHTHIEHVKRDQSDAHSTTKASRPTKESTQNKCAAVVYRVCWHNVGHMFSCICE